MIKSNFMKKYILLVFLLFSAIGYTVGQTSQNSGEWNADSTWVGNPPPSTIQNNYPQNIIVISVADSVWLNNTLVNNKNGFTIDVNGKLTIDSIYANNRLNLIVRNTGVFVVNGGIDVNNILGVTVHEGGQLIVGGGISLKNNATILVDGELSAEIISGNNNNNLLGDGTLYLPDEDALNGININGFNGNIVYGDTDLTLPAPFNLSGFEISGPKVQLNWEFNLSLPSNFIGFQIFKNNSRPSQPSYLVDVIPVFSIDGIDITVESIDELSFLDSDLNSFDEPKYFVRAVYNFDGNIRYSSISNVIDFLNQPLPIELLSFYARALDYAIGLYWSTAVEINNMGFEIQRLDVKTGNWDVIGWVDGNYNHNGVLNYSYTDFNPQEGVNYYRLRQIDYDGVYEFYGPVAAAMDTPADAFDLKVVRNHNQVFVIMPGNETGLLEVFDLTGKRISAQYASGSLNMHLARGTYIIRFSGSYQTATAKVVL